MEKAYKALMDAVKAGHGVRGNVERRMVERGDLPITPQLDSANKALAKSLTEAAVVPCTIDNEATENRILGATND